MRFVDDSKHEFFVEKENAKSEINGFSEQTDIFKRKNIGESLYQFLHRSQNSLVVSIDNPWGEGKTTFFKMWQSHFAESARIIYFDAFKNDLSSDPLSSLLGEFYEHFGELLNQNQPLKDKFLSKAKPAVQALAIGGLKAGIRAGTMGILDGSFLDGANTDSNKDDAYISSELASATGGLVESYLESYSKNKNAVEDFKKAIEEIVNIDQDKPVIFIVDEIDRCKPSYAVELLETIKHIFSVPSVHFVLGINKDSLEESIKGQYGSGINAEIYLQKFIDFSVTLPMRVPGKNARHIYFMNLINQMGYSPDFGNRELIYISREFCEFKELSFRDIEKMLPWLGMLLSQEDNEFPELTIFCIYLRVLKRKSYKALVSDDYFDIDKEFGLVNGNCSELTRTIKELVSMIAAVKTESTNDKLVSSLGLLIHDHLNLRDEFIQRINYLERFFTNFKFN